MPSPPLHEASDLARRTKGLVGLEDAFPLGDVQLRRPAVEEPCDLEPHARVDERVEMAASVLQREGVRVRKGGGDLELQLDG